MGTADTAYTITILLYIKATFFRMSWERTQHHCVQEDKLIKCSNFLQSKLRLHYYLY